MTLEPAATGACPEFSNAASRRGALRAALGLTGLAAVATFGGAFMETAYAASGKADRMLVVLSLRGAADGLSLVVPHGDPVYYQARPSIAVPKDQLLVGDSFFGLHPSLRPLLPMWKSGKMAAIHAAGQLVTTRSHFAAMEEVEDSDPGSSARVGWLNRLVNVREQQSSYLTAVQLGSVVQATQLAGPAPSLSATDVDRLELAGPDGDQRANWEKALTSLWSTGGSDLARGGRAAIGVADELSRVPNGGKTVYPRGELGDSLRGAARILKADVGAEVITVDQGSWDHHQWVGNLNNGNMKNMADDLGEAIAAFFNDLGPLADRVTLVTVTEFGRRVKENANQGLDHGHGSVMFALGAGVTGGYYGRWPGLQNNVDSDLSVTTDYRDVLGEVVGALYPERALGQIFPGLQHRPVGFMGGALPPINEPDPDSPPPTTESRMTEAYFESFGNKSGKARVGRKARAPKPSLSSEGVAAGVSTSYRWETVSPDGKVRGRGRTRNVRVKPGWRGSNLRVKVFHTADGHSRMKKVYYFGRVR